MKYGLISVLIPVYKESNLLEDILQKLLNQKTEKEIFVIIDEPTIKSLKVSRKFGKKVKFFFNKQRKGKANVLNKTVKLTSGEILLFLDSDIKLSDDKDFLKKIIEEIKDAGFLDIKKEMVKGSFLSRMTYFEYVGINAGSWLISKFVEKCPSINGSAFAVKKEVFDSLDGFRKVVSEDIDIAMRGFIKNYKFKYTKEVKVYNYAPSNWKDWMEQRKRWSTGKASCYRKFFCEFSYYGIRYLHVFVPALSFIYPFMVLLFLIATAIINNLFVPAICFLSYFILFFIFSKKLGFEFKIIEFLVYFFVFSPVAFLFMVAGLIKVFIFNESSVSDWKI